MAGQQIQQADIWGRLGTGLGQGVAEQFPKEMERTRLAAGLRDLESQQNLTPFQQFARLSAIPGITPQMIQSGAELLRQQGIRNAYKNNRPPLDPYGTSSNAGLPGETPLPNSPTSSLGLPNQSVSRSSQVFNQLIPSGLSREEEITRNQPAANENPLSQKFIPPSPWTQQKQDDAINEAFDRGVATNFQEAAAYAKQQKELYEQAPQKYRDKLEYKKGIDNEVDNLLDKQLQTRLQKEGKETFKDITGDMQLNMKKEARNAVATGKMTPNQAAEYFSKKALDLVKDKNRVLEIANRDVIDRLLPHKKTETIKNLKQIAKTYAELGSSEEFYNLLRSDKIDDKTGEQLGMGLSPGGAAVFAYERSPQVKNLINKTKLSSQNPTVSTRAFADELSKAMGPRDSFLAIARIMKQKDPVGFDEYAFFDYLRENANKFTSNPTLQRELNQGVSDFFPNWRDIGLFPVLGGSIAND